MIYQMDLLKVKKDVNKPWLITKKAPISTINVRFFLKDVFGYAEQQGNGTYCLGSKLTIERKKDDKVLSHPLTLGEAVGAAQARIDAANDAKKGGSKLKYTSWYLAHYTKNFAQDTFLWRQMISKAPPGISYLERWVFPKEVTTENNLLN